VIPGLSSAQPLCNPYCFSAVISLTPSAILVIVNELRPVTGIFNRVTCMYLHLDFFIIIQSALSFSLFDVCFIESQVKGPTLSVCFTKV